MSYKYTVYNSQKQITKGVLDVAEKDIAVRILEQAGHQILSLKKTGRIELEDVLNSLSSVKKIDIVLFTRQLAMLMEKGVRFVTALQLARDQVKSKLFKKKLGSVIEDVEAGKTFADAIAKFPEVFPEVYRNMTRIGEKSGELESILKEIAEEIEQDDNTKKKIRNAFIYPGIIFGMGVVTVVILVTTVLPSLTKLMSTFKTELPLPTRITMGFADFLTANGLYLMGGLLVFALIMLYYSRTKSGKFTIERFILSLPVIGQIVYLRNLFQFSRVTSLMLRAGLPVVEVIETAKQGVQSETISRELNKIPASLMQGNSLSRSMEKSKLFPLMVVQMVFTGEETNSLESSFDALSEHYRFEFNQALETFIALLEPVLIAVVGLIIGFVAVSAMMPMFSIYSVM